MKGGITMLNVQEAVRKLDEAGITKNPEVFRRWLRQGKIKGAVIRSKKEGWLIPETSVQDIIATNKNKSSINEEYRRGYEDGIKEAAANRKTKMRALVIQGAHDMQFSIHRQDFQELSPVKTKDYLKFVDKEFFSWGVKNPRKSMVVNYLEGWLSYDNLIILYLLDYDVTDDVTLEDQAREALGEYLRQKFIATKK